MSFILPPQGTEVRELIDVRFLVELVDNHTKIPTLEQACQNALKSYDTRGFVRSLHVFVRDEEHDINHLKLVQLTYEANGTSISVAPLWDFGSMNFLKGGV